jgi:hypothetical protein
VFRPALGPTQPPVQWVPRALSLGIKRTGREADHSLPSNAEVKECVELYLHSLNMSSWRGAELSTGTTLLLLLHDTRNKDFFGNKHSDAYSCGAVTVVKLTVLSL